MNESTLEGIAMMRYLFLFVCVCVFATMATCERCAPDNATNAVIEVIKEIKR